MIFQSTSTSTEPQLTSVSSRLWLATTSVGQCSSSLGGSVTRTSPCAETLNQEAKRKWLLSPRGHWSPGIKTLIPLFSSHLVVTRPSHQTDQVTSRMSVLVRGCGGPTGSAGVHSRGQVSKVPGRGYRSDGGGGRETNAAVNILHWKRPQRDGKVHLKHIVGQSPTAFLHRADNSVSASYSSLRALNVGLIESLRIN